MYKHKQKKIICFGLTFFLTLSSFLVFDARSQAVEASYTVVQTVDIGIQPSDYKSLISNTSEPSFSVRISVDNGPMTYGKIKLRGSASKALGLSIPTKRIPVQIFFDQQNPMGETINNSCIKLINSLTPYRLFAEYTALELFSYCGIPTPAHEFVFLRYNDVDFGLYLAIEDVNETFLEKHFSQPFGSLYKGAEGDHDLPFSSSQWFGDLRAIREAGDKQILALLDALDRGDGYEEYLDVDEVLRFFACTAVYGGASSILTEQSNYFLYDNGEKFVLLPWDLSEAFSAEPTSNGIDHFQLDFWEEAPSCAIFDLLMQNEKNRESYHAYIQDLNDRFLDPEKMGSYFQSAATLLSPYLSRDHTILFNLPYELPVVPEEGYGTFGSLLSVLTHIHKNLKEQLEGTEDVFYVNPATKDFPPLEEFDRRVEYILQNSPSIDPNITNQICVNYSSYCRSRGITRFATGDPAELAAALAVFAVVFVALLFFFRFSSLKSGKGKNKKRSAHRRC